jgi:lipopolysaccharide exporter
MSSDINRKSVSAVKWAAVGTAARFCMQLLTQVILARLLGPESYGLFAMGLVVLTLSGFLADFGFCWGLVQHKTLTEEDIRFAVTWQILSGTTASILLLVSAPWIALYFNEPRVIEVIRWLSLTCVLNALSMPGTNLLRRALDFRMLNIIQLVSYAIGYLLVGITLAWLGAGVWALVSAWLAQALAALVMTFIKSPHSLKPLLWYEGGRRSTSMGATVFFTNLCNWFLNNLDRLLLGRFLNAHAVGVYTIGYNLANTPNSLFISALQPAFLAAGTKLQDDPGRLRSAYLSVQSGVWLLIGPAFVLLSCVASRLIALLYGQAWEASGPVLAILALAMPAYVCWGLSTPILWNTGGKHLESLLQVPVLLGAAVALWLFAGQGAVAVAWIAAGTLLLRAAVICTTACMRLKVDAASILGIAWRALVLMLVTAAGSHAGLGAAAGEGLAVQLFAGSAGGTILPVALVLAWPNVLGRNVIDLLGRFSPPVPVRLGAYLRSRCG